MRKRQMPKRRKTYKETTTTINIPTSEPSQILNQCCSILSTVTTPKLAVLKQKKVKDNTVL